MINEIFQESYLDYFFGADSNPYPEATEEFVSWLSGYLAAKESLTLYYKSLEDDLE